MNLSRFSFKKFKKFEIEDIIFIIIFFLAVVFIALILSNTLHLFPKSFEDLHKYLLSALIQSLATVLTLGITLTLVSIQFTGQVFSAKAYKILLKSFYFWFFILFYIMIIVFCILLLANAAQISRKDLILGTNLAIVSTIFALSILIPYVLAIFKILNSKELIKKLLHRIRIKDVLCQYFVLSTKEEYYELPRSLAERIHDDPLYPVYEIINNSVNKDALNEVYLGIEAVTNKVKKILESTNDYENSFQAFTNFYKYYEKYIDFIPRISDKEFSQFLILKFEELFQFALDKENRAICGLTLDLVDKTMRIDVEENDGHNLEQTIQEIIRMGVYAEKAKSEFLINRLKSIILYFASLFNRIVKDSFEIHVLGDPELADEETRKTFYRFKKRIFEEI